MTLQPIGDLAQIFVSRRQMTAVQAALNRNKAEMTTGLVQDRGAHLRGDQTAASALARDSAMVGALARNAQTLAVTSGAMQAALQTVDRLAADLSGQLLSPAADRDGATTGTLVAEARDALAGAVGALNARAGGQALFSGAASDGPALVDADTLLAQVRAAAAGETSVAGITAAVTAWFDDPAGFAAQAYLGGPPRPPVPLAPGETAALPQTAADPALRRTLAGLAIAALAVEFAAGGPSDTAAGLQRAAGRMLVAEGTARTALMADLGLTEGRIAATATRLQAEDTALDRARSDLLSADPYESAAMLTERQTQLETIYAVTARLSRLSLAEFLR